jgi:hypothetical protein
MVQHEKVRHDNETAIGFSPKQGYDGFDFGIALSARCDRRNFG